MKRSILVSIVLVLLVATEATSFDAGNIYWKVPLSEKWTKDTSLTEKNSKAFTNNDFQDLTLFVIYSHEPTHRNKTLDGYFQENTPFSMLGDFVASLPKSVRLWAVIEMKERCDFGNTFGHFFHIVLKSRKNEEMVHLIWAITFRNGSFFEMRALGTELSITEAKPEIKNALSKVEIMESPLGK